VFGHAWLAAVGGFAEDEARRAVFGVALEFVSDVGRRGSGCVVAVELDRAGTVGAAKLGVGVDEGFGDGLEFPEGLVSAAEFEATAFDLALVDFFGFSGHDGLLLEVVSCWLLVVT